MQQNWIATIIIYSSILGFLAESGMVQANSEMSTTTPVIDQKPIDNADKSVAPLHQPPADARELSPRAGAAGGPR